MLKWSYLHFGFFGTVFLALFMFLLFIMYLAGIAGISILPDGDRTKNIKLILSVLIPPFPVIWLFIDVYRQHKAIKSRSV